MATVPTPPQAAIEAETEALGEAFGESDSDGDIVTAAEVVADLVAAPEMLSEKEPLLDTLDDSVTVADANTLPVLLGDTLDVSVDDAATLPVKLGETLDVSEGDAVWLPVKLGNTLAVTTTEYGKADAVALVDTVGDAVAEPPHDATRTTAAPSPPT